MLKINDRFTIDKDTHNIILIETYMGINKKTKEPKQMTRESYYMTMEQVCNVIIDRSAEGNTVEVIADAINAAKRDIINMLKEIADGKAAKL